MCHQASSLHIGVYFMIPLKLLCRENGKAPTVASPTLTVINDCKFHLQTLVKQRWNTIQHYC